MADYKTDAERFWDDQKIRERDARHSENLRALSEHYGNGTLDSVIPDIRKPVMHIEKGADGRVRRLPSASEFPDQSDFDLAERVRAKVEAWDELEDVTDTFGDVFP